MKNLRVSSLVRLLFCAALQQAEPADQLKLLSSTLEQSERQQHHSQVGGKHLKQLQVVSV